MVILTHMAKPFSPDPRIVQMCHIKLFIVIAVKLDNVTVVIIPLKAPHITRKLQSDIHGHNDSHG